MILSQHPQVWPITGILLILVELENGFITLQNEGTYEDSEAGLLAQLFFQKSFRNF